MTLFTLGGMVLVIDRANVDASGTNQMLGLLAVMVATAAWCVDNTLPRAVADRDPGQVVMLKGALGALATTLMAAVFGEAVSALLPTLALLAVGATGDGLSLHFYLLAQRAFGAARTGSVFAFALFVRALFTFTPGERSGNSWIPAGAVLMAQGIVLHLAESHGHENGHDEKGTRKRARPRVRPRRWTPHPFARLASSWSAQSPASARTDAAFTQPRARRTSRPPVPMRVLFATGLHDGCVHGQ